jgi:hypothetical protein
MAGYSGTPLLKKLGIKEGFRCFYLQAPDNYLGALGKLPPGVKVEGKLAGEFDFIHAFFEAQKAFHADLPRLQKRLKKTGMLWISWRKGKVSDLTDNVVRTTGLTAGLVDVKVCAVDDAWSALKFVYRLKDR